MASLLILGGSGFFGKSFLDSFRRGLLDQWDIGNILIVSRRASRLATMFPDLVSSRVKLIDGDLAKLDSVPKAELVIHAAASTDIRDYDESSSGVENIQKNVSNYVRLLREYHATSKILFVSSGAVYGNQPDSTPFLTEHSKFQPLDTMPNGKRQYAKAKRLAEGEFLKIAQDGVNVSIARCFAFVGKWLPLDQHFAAGSFIKNIIFNNSLVVNASHQVIRSYMHSDDLVDWLLSIAHSSSTQAPIYNVGSEDGVSLQYLARALAEKFKLPYAVAPLTSNLADRYVPSTEKALAELDLKPKYNSLEAILAVTNELKKNNV